MRRRSSRRVHHYKRTVAADVVTVLAGFVGYFSTTFQLSDLQDVADFTNLYDQFRINKVVYKLIPKFTPNNVNVNANSNPGGEAVSVLDYNDASTPSSISQLLQYGNVRKSKYWRGITRTFTPAVLVNGYKSAVGNAYLSKYKQWISMGDITTPHYGVKWALDATGCFGDLKFDVYKTYYFSCKNVR